MVDQPDLWPEGAWPFLRSMIVREEVESTSDLAARVVRDGKIPLPLGIWAYRQTRGRGRGDHVWWSDEGSLTFTLAIDPEAHGLDRASEPKLALATAVAVIEAIEGLGYRSPALGIRWPNDIQMGIRKLGGILPERIETSRGPRLLIGLGLNVATDPIAMPPQIRGMAASLAEMAADSRPRPGRSECLRAILDHLGAILPRLSANDTDLACRWNALDLLRDEPVRVALGSRIVVGIGAGIDAEGALVVDVGSKEERLSGGTVLR